MLTQLIPSGNLGPAFQMDIPDLPQPILLEHGHKQEECAPTVATGQMLRATVDVGLSNEQQHARKAHVPGPATHSHDQPWLTVMTQHALPVCHPASSVNNHNTDAGDDANDSASTVTQDLSNSIKQSILFPRVVSEPVPPMLPQPLLRLSVSCDGLLLQLFTDTSKPETPDVFPSVGSAHPGLMGNSKATYCNLIAQDMALQGSICTLPVVLFDDTSAYGTDEAESRVDTWQQCMADCHIRQQKTRHLKLYMDWSLSERSSSSSRTLQVYKRHLDQNLCPAALPPVQADSALDDSLCAASFIDSIAGRTATPPGVPYNAVRQPEQLPHAVRARLQSQAQHTKQSQHAKRAQQVGHAKQAQQPHGLSRGLSAADESAPESSRLAASLRAKPVSGATLTANPTPGSSAALPSTAPLRFVQPAKPVAPAGDMPTAAQQAQASGVFQKPQPQAKAKRKPGMQQAATPGNDMAFFLRLQQGAATDGPGPKNVRYRGADPALPPALRPAQSADQPHVVDLCTDDDSQGEEERARNSLPDVQYSVLRLPERHQSLLQRMEEEHAAILRQHSGIDTQVGVSNILIHAQAVPIIYSLPL